MSRRYKLSLQIQEIQTLQSSLYLFIYSPSSSGLNLGMIICLGKVTELPTLLEPIIGKIVPSRETALYQKQNMYPQVWQFISFPSHTVLHHTTAHPGSESPRLESLFTQAPLGTWKFLCCYFSRRNKVQQKYVFEGYTKNRHNKIAV